MPNYTHQIMKLERLTEAPPYHHSKYTNPHTDTHLNEKSSHSHSLTLTEIRTHMDGVDKA